MKERIKTKIDIHEDEQLCLLALKLKNIAFMKYAPYALKLTDNGVYSIEYSNESITIFNFLELQAMLCVELEDQGYTIISLVRKTAENTPMIVKFIKLH